MSPEAAAWVIGGAVGLFALATVGVLMAQGNLIARGDTSHPVLSVGPRLTAWVCAAPPRRFTVDQAHTAMQLHVDCLIDECPRKRHAYNVLLQAGHVRPDSGRVHA